MIQTHRVWDHEFQFSMRTHWAQNWYDVKWFGGTLEAMNQWGPALRKLINPGDVVIDVGANVGWMTCIFAKQVGSTGHVIAIEAELEAVDALRENVGLNNMDQVEIVHAAAWDGTVPELEFFDCRVGGDRGLGRKVPTVTLDDWAYLRPSFVKIDVEGAEVAVLRGATSILAERATSWEVEVHLFGDTSADPRHFGHDPAELLTLLDGYDLTFYPSGAVQQLNPLPPQPAGGGFIATPRRNV